MTFSELWQSGWMASLFNHLWQSTVVLGAAWLLTLVLRRNAARVRYLIWMLASLKFLVPFALLSNLGARWAKPIAGRTVGSALYTAADEIGQPFQPSFGSVVHPAVLAHPNAWLGYLPAMLAAIWLCGFMVVTALWSVRWIRMAWLAKEACPLEDGRELDALRRAEMHAGLATQMPIRSSLHAIEPGVFGIFRPVLLWPAGISAQLDDAQVASIMAHEAEHVRRRDNLTAALHMLVEALFWFHPAVRWMGSRLMDERERACDEKVLEWSRHPETYAESILKVCAFCLEPPMPCVSGVSGADLKQRILRIMTHRSEVSLSAMRRCVLYAAGVAVIAFPIGFGMLHAMQAPTELVHASAGPAPSFEVVSIKPNHEDGRVRRIGMSPSGFTTTHASLKEIIGLAYGLKGDGQLVGGPSWMDSQYFDIEAKESEVDAGADKTRTMDQRREHFALMIQALLADRFALRTKSETRELPVYALVVANGGVKMKEVSVDPLPPPGTPPPPGAHLPRLIWDGSQVSATAIPMNQVADWLSHFDELDKRVVVDWTGLKGNYDFVLHGVSMGSQFPANKDAQQEPPISIFSALPDQLGLKLESRKAPVEVLVVEHADLPSPN